MPWVASLQRDCEVHKKFPRRIEVLDIAPRFVFHTERSCTGRNVALESTLRTRETTNKKETAADLGRYTPGELAQTYVAEHI